MGFNKISFKLSSFVNLISKLLIDLKYKCIKNGKAWFEIDKIV